MQPIKPGDVDWYKHQVGELTDLRALAEVRDDYQMATAARQLKSIIDERLEQAGVATRVVCGMSDKIDPSVMAWSYDMPPLDDGWRYLKPGEIIKEGDESSPVSAWVRRSRVHWGRCGKMVGQALKPPGRTTIYVRRRVAVITGPGEYVQEDGGVATVHDCVTGVVGVWKGETSCGSAGNIVRPRSTNNSLTEVVPDATAGYVGDNVGAVCKTAVGQIKYRDRRLLIPPIPGDGEWREIGEHEPLQSGDMVLVRDNAHWFEVPWQMKDKGLLTYQQWAGGVQVQGRRRVVWKRTGIQMWRKMYDEEIHRALFGGVPAVANTDGLVRVICDEEVSDHPEPQTRWVPIPVEQ